MKRLNIKITNFWPTAFQGDFFNYFLHEAFESNFSYVDSIEESDIVFTSVFGDELSPQNKTIGFIGENIRPNFSKWAYALSFDEDDWSGKNHMLPLWYQRIKWPGFEYINMREGVNNETHGFEELISIDALISPRPPLSALTELKFCAAIWGNPEALRTNLFDLISSYKNIDGYGNAFRNPLYKSKLHVLKEYKFSLCPENSIYPGYITEKLFDAWAGGTLPIYSGQFSKDSKIVNNKAFINYQDFLNSSELIKKIKYLDEHLESYNAVYSQPLLNYAPSLSDSIQFLRQKAREILSYY
jgi:hypothetical protein